MTKPIDQNDVEQALKGSGLDGYQVTEEGTIINPEGRTLNTRVDFQAHHAMADEFPGLPETKLVSLEAIVETVLAEVAASGGDCQDKVTRPSSDLTVTISGPPKSGKTALQLFLADALEKAGVPCHFVPGDDRPESLAQKLEAASDILKSRTITIREQQRRNLPVFNKA